ncbi:hypothetical protein [Pseudobacteriovorax antillogorgiicola]|uniref:Lipoprotein n=1 Tax=Pseudobacteriovorax antillogorgiicola TaxID=1513793 RepID=A0A1Y6BX58_9BACT|nr:hypothetical protein [Pseudobacteriovorax antillogorgiicola]TCS53182.1 hypothetical protein EDD56_108233 [Pseudobacteriovorax antillogorgiicola]SMF24539.1 hypothetical protein SAMN06296036_10813 [Pseudobacteriovorax antillogorgiicola]
MKLVNYIITLICFLIIASCGQDKKESEIDKRQKLPKDPSQLVDDEERRFGEDIYFNCNTDGENCRLDDQKKVVEQKVGDARTAYTVNYDFTCEPGNYASPFYLTAFDEADPENPQQSYYPLVFKSSARGLIIDGPGNLTIQSLNSKKGSDETFYPGCQLKIEVVSAEATK